MWIDNIIPFPMETVLYQIYSLQFFICDINPPSVIVRIKSTFNLKTGLCRRVRYKTDNILDCVQVFLFGKSPPKV